jgi:hypothetical protein
LGPLWAPEWSVRTPAALGTSHTCLCRRRRPFCRPWKQQPGSDRGERELSVPASGQRRINQAPRGRRRRRRRRQQPTHGPDSSNDGRAALMLSLIVPDGPGPGSGPGSGPGPGRGCGDSQGHGRARTVCSHQRLLLQTGATTTGSKGRRSVVRWMLEGDAADLATYCRLKVQACNSYTVRTASRVAFGLSVGTEMKCAPTWMRVRPGREFVLGLVRCLLLVRLVNSQIRPPKYDLARPARLDGDNDAIGRFGG